MKHRFLENIKNNNLFSKEDKLIVAISGGADSVALAILLNECNFPIIFAHCNFNLREDESDADEDFVRKLAKELEVECFVESFEKQIKKRLFLNKGKYVTCIKTGTDAIKIALLALDVGVDDEVITVAHTWISTAEVISIINAKPVFIDIEDETFNMDPEKIEEKITDKTKPNNNSK